MTGFRVQRLPLTSLKQWSGCMNRVISVASGCHTDSYCLPLLLSVGGSLTFPQFIYRTHPIYGEWSQVNRFTEEDQTTVAMKDC